MTAQSSIQNQKHAQGGAVESSQGDRAGRYRLHPQAAHRLVGGEVFIVTGDRRFHRLKARTAVDLFSQLAKAAESGCDAAQLVDLLVGRYNVAAAQAAADVNQFISDLVQREIAIAIQA